jgi:hypothetical protein
VIGQLEGGFQALPVKARSRIAFAAWRNVLMARHMCNGVVPMQVQAQTTQLLILGVFEHIALQAFEFDPNRVVIALGATSVFGLTGMPGPIVGADKLPQAAVTPNIKVRGHLQVPDL